MQRTLLVLLPIPQSTEHYDNTKNHPTLISQTVAFTATNYGLLSIFMINAYYKSLISQHAQLSETSSIQHASRGITYAIILMM